MDHRTYDKRQYPIVDVKDGYGEWAATYEQVVQDEMDLRLLERLSTMDWAAPQQVLDLACGTGRIGLWLRQRSSAPIDGVDLTPAMLAVARQKKVYRSLHLANITQTGLPADAYDLCTQSLADEHLPDLLPLYQEVARLTRVGGHFALVGFHPQFLMAGVPTHYQRSAEEAITIRSYVHLLSDHVKAAHQTGWRLQSMDEGLVDDAWMEKKPKWRKYLGLPVSFVMLWQRLATAQGDSEAA